MPRRKAGNTVVKKKQPKKVKTVVQSSIKPENPNLTRNAHSFSTFPSSFSQRSDYSLLPLQANNTTYYAALGSLGENNSEYRDICQKSDFLPVSSESGQ